MEILRNLKMHIKFAFHEIEKKYLILLLFFSLLNGLQPVIYTYLMKLLIDELANVGKALEGTIYNIVIITVITCIFSVIMKVAMSLYGYLQQKMNRSMGNLFTNNLFSRISLLPLSYIETKQGQDSLYLAQSVMRISPVEICNNIFQMFQSSITLVSFFSAVAFFSPWMIIVIVTVSIPFFIIEFRFNKTFFLLQKRNSPYYREAFYLQQMLIQKEPLSELKFFDYHNTICKRIKILLTFLMKIEMRLMKKRIFWQSWNEILIDVAYWGYYVWVITSFIAGNITLGSVTFFSSAYMSIQGNIHSLFMQTNKTLNDGLLLQNYYNVIKASENIENSGNSPITRIESIKLKNVSFKYPETENTILNNINIEIQKGEKVAFIGENGSGKTTIIKLLLGLYTEYEGEILINGKDIREFNINQYRRLVSVSFQDYKKFFGSSPF